MFLICRDTKLENILLDEEDHCKLADYGLAALGVFPGMTMSSAKGTQSYLAPEVILVFNFLYDLFIFC
jgi:serine/threonine protein kinase